MGGDVPAVFPCASGVVGDELGWDRFVDERVSGLFEGRTWAFAYPV